MMLRLLSCAPLFEKIETFAFLSPETETERVRKKINQHQYHHYPPQHLHTLFNIGFTFISIIVTLFSIIVTLFSTFFSSASSALSASTSSASLRTFPTVFSLTWLFDFSWFDLYFKMYICPCLNLKLDQKCLKLRSQIFKVKNQIKLETSISPPRHLLLRLLAEREDPSHREVENFNICKQTTEVKHQNVFI